MKVELSHPDKVLFPEDGITKADVADYYDRVAEWMLPHVRGRPVSMQRFPDGVAAHGFYHKDAPDYFPDWIARVELPKAGGTVTHVLIENRDTLRYLANQNTITPHVFLSRADRPNRPDRLVFDLDPAEGTDFATVRRAARWTAELLSEIELVPFAQVTGSKGIHIWTPLLRRAETEDARALARDAADVLAQRHPDELTTEFRKAKRGGRILVDVARNGYAQTAVPPYAIRPRAGAPVATPITLAELSDSRLRPDRWTVRNVLRRLAGKGDPWADMSSHARGLATPRERLAKLLR